MSLMMINNCDFCCTISFILPTSTYILKAIFTFTCKINASYNTFERNNFSLDHLSRGLRLTTGYRHRLVSFPYVKLVLGEV